ncbi:MAG: UbiD family decarboxylase [Clostridioides sp.]|jgi:hypothetical protein|nr:UbiD family decarboxylase [Clostridioides sp.]
MEIKKIIDECMGYVERYSKIIVKFSLSALGVIVLVMVILLNKNTGVRAESKLLLDNIENKQYSVAIDYYENIEKKLSGAKREKFNRTISTKINKFLIANGDKYISGELSKEQFINLINTINALNGLDINKTDIINQAKRVADVYENDKIDYDVAISYINSVSILTDVNGKLDKCKKDIETFKESREIFKLGQANQEAKKYFEAIENYNKVVKSDKAYYDLAQKEKKECIDKMYDHYIKLAEANNKDGEYESSLMYVGYLKPYYTDDAKLQNLEKECQGNMKLYTMSNEDIINRVSKESNIPADELSVESLSQMIGDDKYYYAEVYRDKKLINEVLIQAETKKIYSYKYEKKDYDVDYGSGYFMIDENGSYKFSISEDNAKKLVEKRLVEKNVKYKKLDFVDEEEADKRIGSTKKVEDILKDEKNIYYYIRVNKGFFKEKDILVVNIYTKMIYNISNGEETEY